MKKILLFASALAGLLLAGSCQRESLEPEAVGVTYTINLPEVAQTKGNSGYTEYDLYYEVYKTVDDDELETADILFEKKVEMTGNTVTLTLDLLNDQNYTILFWANKKGIDDKVFDRSDLRKVQIEPSLSNNNDRDAFYGMDQLVNYDAATGRTVTLTRPFAQLNIATLVSTTAGYDMTPNESYVKVTKVPTVFNVLTSEASRDAEVVFDWAAVPAGKKVNDKYDLVAMNYVLVPESIVDVYYQIKTVNGTVNNSVGNVPLKPNYRTNIVGNLLTSNATYTIELKPGFEGEYVGGPEFVKEPAYDAETKTYTVVDRYELLWVAQQVNTGNKDFAGETVQLAADIDLENKPWTPIGLNADDAKKFKGTFEGVALTKADTYPVIRNLYVETSPGYTAAGFFGALNGTAKNFGIENATIKHISTGDPTDNGIAVVAGSIYNKGNIEGVTVKNATVEGNRYVGGIAGYTYGNVKNCSVENLTLKAIPNQLADGSYDNGDKVGGIVAAFWWESTYNVSGNTAKNVSIYAYRDAGIIAGFATGAGVKNNTVEGKNNITIDQETYFYKEKPANAGEIVGNLSGVLADGNAVTGEVSYTTHITVDDAKEFAEVLAAAKNGDIISVPAGEFALPTTMFDDQDPGTITLVGNGMENTLLNGAKTSNNQQPANYAHGKHLVFKDITFKTVNDGYQGGFGHAASVTFINCKIIGQMYAHSNAPHYFYDCTIDPLNGYLYTYASDCVFEGCTFEASEGKALQVFGEADVECDVTIKDCTFKADKPATTWDNKPVTGIDINSANNYRVNVNIENCTTTGFPIGLNSECDLYNIKDGGDGKVNLVIDGVYVARAGYTALAKYPNIWVKDNNYYVFDKAGLSELNAYFVANWCGNDTWNHEYHIGADIDAAGFTWNSVWVNVGDNGNNGLVLNGNGHTINDLAINGSFFTGTPNGGNEGTTPGYVKDLTIDNATVTGDHWTAVFWGNSYGELVYENVTVKNTSVTGNCNAAIFLGGTVYEDGKGIDNILFKNCKVENCSIVANGKDGQDPTGASVFCSRAFGKTKLTFEGTNSIDDATTITNENGLVGGKVYGYTLHTGSAWAGTGACDTFINWDGISAVSTEETFLAALREGKAAILLNDITITNKWDRRSNGATTNVPSVIDGNGHTLYFNCEVTDGNNYGAAFRFENNAVVSNLTIDMSNATGKDIMLRAISSAGNLTIDNCAFIGNDAHTKDNAVVFGDTNASAQLNYEVYVTNSTFNNWRRGVSDNENAKEVRTATFSGNTFINANAYISVYESVTFTGNTLSGSLVNITSYTNSVNAKVTATGNTLAAEKTNAIGSSSKMFTAANVEAQEGFFVNAQ